MILLNAFDLMKKSGMRKFGMNFPSGYLASNIALVNCQKTFQNVTKASF